MKKSLSFGEASKSFNFSIVIGSSRSFFKITSWWLIFAFSSWSCIRFLILSFDIFSLFARRPSKEPNSLINLEAVFGPMPGTPGMLSTLSPIKACTSVILSGPTPNFSITFASSISIFFIGSMMRLLADNS